MTGVLLDRNVKDATLKVGLAIEATVPGRRAEDHLPRRSVKNLIDIKGLKRVLV